MYTGESLRMTEEERNRHYRKMTETPVSSLIGRLAVPTIISMMVSALYNTADTFFVSMLGTSAAGAVGIVFSIMAIIQAIGFTIGMGAGNILSRQLGAKEDEKATITASSGFFFALLLSVLLAVSGTLFRPALMRLLGATPTILPYAEAYATYIFAGCPVMCCSFVMNNYLRAEGKAMFGMIGITTGGILNIILDPIYIFSLGFGTAGAAMATALSQLVSFCILLSFFLRGKSSVRIQISKVSREVRTYASIVRIGLPTLMRQGLASVASIALNVAASSFGDAAVAAMSITSRISMFAFSAMLGFGQGFQPVTHGVLTARAAGNHHPGQPRVFFGGNGPAVFHRKLEIRGGKDEDQPPDSAAAAEGTCRMPVERTSPPFQKLLGRAVGGCPHAAASPGGHDNCPGLLYHLVPL